MNEFPKTWDNTMRSMGKSCPRKLYFFMKGYEPVVTKSYFVWGNAWHKMMDVWYQSDFSSRAFQEALGEGLIFYDDNIQEESQGNTREGLISAFRYYTERYENEPFKLIKGASEQGFQWPLVGTEYYYAGSMDGYVEWKPYGILALDHKSTGEYLTDSYIGQWEFSPQMIGYHWYLAKIHEDVYGVLINMITKKVPTAKSNWTTPRVHRVLVRKTESDLEEFETDVVNDIRYFKSCFDADYWPKTTNPRNCVGGPGLGACPFKQICLSQVDFRQVDISIYQHLKLRSEPWQPWTRDSE